MVFDKEEQRKIILELLDSVTIPGKAMDVLFAFKQQVIAGEVRKVELKEDPLPGGHRSQCPDELGV
jgi:hypothetical protein